MHTGSWTPDDGRRATVGYNCAMLTITHLNAYRGPNIFGPQPGVRLRLHADADYTRRLRAALKDGAQFIGLMLANLELTALPSAAGTLIEARFITDAPGFGAELCHYVVLGMNAELADDQEWDRDTPLFDLQARRRQAYLPPTLLQLMDEARRRDLPVLRLADGQVQFGHGSNALRLQPTELRRAAPPDVAWEQLRRVEVIAVTGGTERAALAERLAAHIPGAQCLPDADYAASVALLAEATAERVVLGLNTTGLLQYGTPFDHCAQAVICRLDEQRPEGAADDDEWVRAVGLPMLLATTPAQIDLRDPRLHALVPYAPYGLENSGFRIQNSGVEAAE